MISRRALIAFMVLLPCALPAQDAFSEKNAARLLRTLSVEIGPRPMGSPGEQAAMRFAVDRFRAYGCDTAYIMPMTEASAVNTSSGIAVGIRKGKSGRIIVLGGHIDSAGPEIPGANDDGSGCAVVLEAARVLCARENESTILFALFGGEERGLQGSRYFVDHFPGIDSVVLMLQTDMANGLGTIMLDPDTRGASAPAWLVRGAVEEFDILGYSGLSYPAFYSTVNYSGASGSASDHAPFLEAGIPAIDFTTDVGDPIHTPQDTYENFDTRGLKRSGDLVTALVRRFDAGVPSRETEQYWLFLLFSFPVIVPYAGLWTFVLLTLLFSLFTLYRLRKHHLSLRSREGYEEAKWPGLKITIAALISAFFAWMSPDLIGLIKGDRFPWFAHPGHYYILGLIALVFGLLTALHIFRKLRITRSPYILFKRAAIFMVPVVAISAAVGIETAVFPAICLLLMSFAVTTGNFLVSVPAAILAPVGLFRLIFSEADELMFRFAAPLLPTETLSVVLINGIWIVAIGILIAVGMFGLVAALRWAEISDRIVTALRSRRFLVTTAGIFWIYATYLFLLPAYERPWFPTLKITETFDAESPHGSLSVRSTEFLGYAGIRFEGSDTTIRKKVLDFSTHDSALQNPGWLRVLREVTTGETDTGTAYDVTLTLSSAFRPYTVSVTMDADSGPPPRLRTPFRTSSTAGTTNIEWYSFPDATLRIPLSFTVPRGGAMNERIELSFDSLAVPVTVEYRQSNIIRRTEYRANHRYTGDTKTSGPGDPR